MGLAATEETTIRCLTDLFEHYVKPVAIYSDNGSHFGQRVTAWLRDQGVEHIKSSSYSPSSTGMVEKRNLGGVQPTIVRTDHRLGFQDSGRKLDIFFLPSLHPTRQSES